MSKRINILCFVMMFTVLTLSKTIWASGVINLPQTGQTKCYNQTGQEIACAETGQDSDILAGVPWPNPRFTVNGDTTITDNLTGLIWAPDGNIIQSRDPSFDTDGADGDGQVSWDSALKYVKETLNKENYLGHSDWRLPNVNEMESLINAGEASSATWLYSKGFTNVQSNFYWSSTSKVSGPSYKWVVDIDRGIVSTGVFSHPHYVWPVRAGRCGLDTSGICLSKTGQAKCYDSNGNQISCANTGQDGELQMGVASPTPRFTYTDDGTVTDNLTGLMWTQNANIMQSRDPSFDTNNVIGDGAVTWFRALEYVAKLNNENYLGHTNWRLPNKRELRSLCDYSIDNPSLPLEYPFKNWENAYWSSTTYTAVSRNAWYINIKFGSVNSNVKSDDRFLYLYVWPVCTAPPPPDSTTTTTSKPPVDCTINISVTPPEGGTTSPSGSIVLQGCNPRCMTVTAIPNPGYLFTHWEGSVEGIVNPINVCVPEGYGTASATAVFEKKPTTTTTSIIITTTIPSGTTTTTIPGGTTTTTTPKPPQCAAEEIYGEQSEQTELLRKYRDNVLNKTSEGQEIIIIYYKFSPAVTKLLEHRPQLKNKAKAYIDSMLPGIRKKVEESNKNP